MLSAIISLLEVVFSSPSTNIGETKWVKGEGHGGKRSREKKFSFLYVAFLAPWLYLVSRTPKAAHIAWYNNNRYPSNETEIFNLFNFFLSRTKAHVSSFHCLPKRNHRKLLIFCRLFSLTHTFSRKKISDMSYLYPWKLNGMTEPETWRWVRCWLKFSHSGRTHNDMKWRILHSYLVSKYAQHSILKTGIVSHKSTSTLNIIHTFHAGVISRNCWENTSYSCIHKREIWHCRWGRQHQQPWNVKENVHRIH